MKKILTLIICLLPSKMAIGLLKLLGHKISWNSRIGFSFILVPNLTLGNNSKIGHFNIVKIDEINLESKAYIGNFNVIKGPLSLEFSEEGSIGNYNVISRANLGVTYGNSVLKIGKLSKITARHFIDLTRCVSIGDFSTLAGASSQIWTHGYAHENKGKGRVRIDGNVDIGNNVYIGASSVINAGVKISDAISVGSNSTVSKDLTEPGMYVNQRLRFIDKNINDVRSALQKVDAPNLVEDVYSK